MPREEPPQRELVVVGVDGSGNASAALRWALDDARTHRRRVHAVLCYGEGGSHRHPTIPSMAAEQAERAERRLAVIIDTVASAGDADVITTEVVAVTTGGVDEALLAAAEGADLLVVGRSGKGRALRFALGSVSSRCVERATCPVVVVPDPSD